MEENKRGFSGRIFIGADGFGEKLKVPLVKHLREERGLEVEDLGTDNYYTVAASVARAVQARLLIYGVVSSFHHIKLRIFQVPFYSLLEPKKWNKLIPK